MLVTWGAARAFSPEWLFSNGEQGWVYDPSNLSTLFQDSAGTTPVTAMEQPVGLQLDTRLGAPTTLGAEVVTNGDFSGGSTGWTLGTGWAVGSGVATHTGATAGYLSQVASVTAGKSYKITVTITQTDGRALQLIGAFWSPPGTVNIGSTVGTFTVIATPSSSGTIWLYANTSGTTISVDNISVRELPGNHRYQTTSANRPVVSARVNLLTKTEDFSDAVWTTGTKDGDATVSKTPNYGAAPDGTTTACRLVASKGTTGTYAILRTTAAAVISNPHTTTSTVWMKSNTGATQNVNFNDGSVFNSFPVTATWTSFTYTKTTNTTIAYFDIGVTPASDPSIDILIWHPDSRVANIGAGLPAYQRVNTSTDYDTAGFPVYIKPNGSNQFMVTNSINFSATDKMTVWAGFRQAGLTAYGTLIEQGTGTAQPGGWSVFSPGQADGQMHLFMETTCKKNIVSPGAPATNVLSLSFDRTAVDWQTELLPRLNGSVPANFSGGANPNGGSVTGNFGNLPTYFYMRGGTTLPFNGHDYGSICRGAASTAGEITSAETWINQRTKAF